MKLSAIKEIKEKCSFEQEELREALENMVEGQDDFQVGDYRFIHENAIDGVMKDELLGDEYMLGCFNAWFIADIIGESTGLNTDDIKEMQQNEQYIALGKMMSKHIEDVVDGVASSDGYGSHFNSYDGSEEHVYSVSNKGNFSYYYFQVG